MNTKDINEFSILCRPLIEYLMKHYNPNTTIIINYEGAKIIQDELFIPYEKDA